VPGAKFSDTTSTSLTSDLIRDWPAADLILMAKLSLFAFSNAKG
jgi:hypothetical protein